MTDVPTHYIFTIAGLLLFTTSCINGNLEGGDPKSDDKDTGTPTTGCPDTGCGTNAVCQNDQCVCVDGYLRGPADACIPEQGPVCGGDRCGTGSRCIDDSCRCDPDFFRDADGCTATEPSAPADRTRDRVCQRWANQRTGLASDLWAEAPSSSCDPGRLSPLVQRQALKYLNLYRWFVGVGPVTAHRAFVDRAQACATAIAAEGKGPTHNVTSSFQCYSASAATGAKNANIAKGVDHPAESVELYVWDRNSPALGHRRWLFNPTMKRTGFGQRAIFSCMYATDTSRDADPTHLAFPPPGYLPAAAHEGPWSFMSTKFRITDAASVSITAADSGQPVRTEDIRTAPGNYAGLHTLAWTVPDAQPDTPYRVQLTGLGKNADKSHTYTTTLTACD